MRHNTRPLGNPQRTCWRLRSPLVKNVPTSVQLLPLHTHPFLRQFGEHWLEVSCLLSMVMPIQHVRHHVCWALFSYQYKGLDRLVLMIHTQVLNKNMLAWCTHPLLICKKPCICRAADWLPWGAGWCSTGELSGFLQEANPSVFCCINCIDL